MNRLKVHYMQNTLFRTEPKPYFVHEDTPFRTTSFLSELSLEEVTKTNQINPRFDSVNTILKPSDNYLNTKTAGVPSKGTQKPVTARLPLTEQTQRKREAKSSKLEALIVSGQPVKSIAASQAGTHKNKLSALSARGENLGWVPKSEATKTPPVEDGEKTEKSNKELSEEEINQILEPKTKTRTEEQKKLRLSTLAKTMKMKKAEETQAGLKAQAELIHNPELLKTQLTKFYESVDQAKSEAFIENIIQHIQSFGIEAFQQKLKEKYGRGLDFDGETNEVNISNEGSTALKDKINAFYERMGDPKDSRFVAGLLAHVEEHGIESLNKKFLDKYGEDLEGNKIEPNRDGDEDAKLKNALRMYYNGRLTMEEHDLNKLVEHIKVVGIEDFNQKLIDKYGEGVIELLSNEKDNQEEEKPKFLQNIVTRPEEKKPARRMSAVLTNMFSVRINKQNESEIQGSTATEEAKKPARPLTTILSNLINFRGGRKSVIFSGSKSQEEAELNSSNEIVEKPKTNEEELSDTEVQKEAETILQSTEEKLKETKAEIEKLKEILEFTSAGPTSEYKSRLDHLQREEEELEDKLRREKVEALI